MVAVHDHHGFEMLLELPTALGNCDATFQQHSKQLVDQRRSLANEPVTRTVQRLYVELRLTLQRHKPHSRPRRCLGNCLGVTIDEIANKIIAELDAGRVP
jgi:hypothetical protein